MRLHKLKVENFRKLRTCEVEFRDATFLIGPNNTGKSSLFRAIEYLHGAKNVDREDYSKTWDEASEDYEFASDLTIIGEYRNVPEAANRWTGFAGRVLPVDHPLPGETKCALVYKKVWKIDKTKPETYIKEYARSVSEKYKEAKTVADLEGDDFARDLLVEHFGASSLDAKLTTKKILEKLNDLPAYWEFDTNTDPTWFENPGGIPGNVLSRLPSVVSIPAESCMDELTGANGALIKHLGQLFEQVREQSENYKTAQVHLNALAEELDPSNPETDFGKLIESLNAMTHRLFPDSSVHCVARLDEPEKSIKPQFNVEMESNVKTPVKYQGHGLIRATAFELLRCIHELTNQALSVERSTIYLFEEPEIYLHPAAANQMRDAIYELAKAGCQIIATTHSPYMVNLGSPTPVSLSKFSIADDGSATAVSLNLDQAFGELKDDERSHLKMLLKVDDYVSRMFFTRKTVFVEGDTEEVVVRETLNRLPREERARIIGNMEFIRARGKAVMIAIARYLNALKIDYHLLHDRDGNTTGQEAVNTRIAEVCGEERRTMLEECIEDVLGYEAPSRDKPFAAHAHITETWDETYESLPDRWREVFEAVCSPYWTGDSDA